MEENLKNNLFLEVFDLSEDLFAETGNYNVRTTFHTISHKLNTDDLLMLKNNIKLLLDTSFIESILQKN